ADAAIVELPLGEALADARHQLIAVGRGAPVAQRDQRPDRTRDRPRLVARRQRRRDRLVIVIVTLPFGGDLEVVAQVQFVAVPYETAAGAAAVLAGDAAAHETEVLAEV